MIRALIFDCFGVLYGASFDVIQSMVSANRKQELEDLRHAHDHGFVDRDEFVSQIADMCGKDSHEILDLMNKKHVLNEPLVELIVSLRGQYKIAMLTNTGAKWIDELFPSELKAKLFDDVVESSTVGMIKPHPEIFELVAQRLGLEPSECLMIDDAPENCEGALVAGMESLHFVTTEQTIASIKRRLEIDISTLS